MLELVKVVIGSIIILGSIGYVGNDCTLPDLSTQEVGEDSTWDDYDKLNAIQNEIRDLRGSDIEQYFIDNNIQYTGEDTNGGDDRYLAVREGEWELEVLYDKSSPITWVTLSTVDK